MQIYCGGRLKGRFGGPPDGADKAARRHFYALSRDENTQAICRLSDVGYSDYSTAPATKLEHIERMAVLLESEA